MSQQGRGHLSYLLKLNTSRQRGSAVRQNPSVGSPTGQRQLSPQATNSQLRCLPTAEPRPFSSPGGGEPCTCQGQKPLLQQFHLHLLPAARGRAWRKTAPARVARAKRGLPQPAWGCSSVSPLRPLCTGNMPPRKRRGGPGRGTGTETEKEREIDRKLPILTRRIMGIRKIQV